MELYLQNSMTNQGLSSLPGELDRKNPKVQSPTERPFRLRARNLVTMSVANERGEVKGESSWILVEHASSKHLEVIQS